MRFYLIIILVTVLSCKKKSQEVIDPYTGTYECIEISTDVSPDSAGSLYFHIDTTSINTMISVTKLFEDYLVVIGSYAFVAKFSNSQMYYESCVNGRCTSVRFLEGNRIQINRPFRVGGISYSGKKQ